jgi:hypothetical protein
LPSSSSSLLRSPRTPSYYASTTFPRGLFYYLRDCHHAWCS